MTMEPTTYYSDSTIRITSEGVFLRDRMYTLDALTSAELKQFRSNRALFRTLPLALTAIIGIPALIVNWYSSAFQVPWLQWFDTLCLVGIIPPGLLTIGLIAFYLYLLKVTPRDYVHVIRLEGSFGGASVLATTDLTQARAALAAINEALTERTQESPQAPPMSYDPKEIFPHDDRIGVGGDSVRLENKVYSLDDIKSATYRLVQIDPVADKLDVPINLGYFVQMGGMVLGSAWTLLAIGGMILFLVGIFSKGARTRANAHYVCLSGSFGNVNAFASLNEAHIREIVAAINLARKNRSATNDPTPARVS